MSIQKDNKDQKKTRWQPPVRIWSLLKVVFGPKGERTLTAQLFDTPKKFIDATSAIVPIPDSEYKNQHCWKEGGRYIAENHVERIFGYNLHTKSNTMFFPKCTVMESDVKLESLVIAATCHNYDRPLIPTPSDCYYTTKTEVCDASDARDAIAYYMQVALHGKAVRGEVDADDVKEYFKDDGTWLSDASCANKDALKYLYIRYLVSAHICCIVQPVVVA